MNPHSRAAGAGFIQEFLVRFRITHRNIVTIGSFGITRPEATRRHPEHEGTDRPSPPPLSHLPAARSRSHVPHKSCAMSALALGLRLVYMVAQASIHDGASTNHNRRETSLSDESIMLNPESYVSVRRTANALLIHVFNGRVLFKPRDAHRPIVVTAGNAQITDVNAAICVRVQNDRTSVTVIDGVVRLSTRGFDEDAEAKGKGRSGTYLINEMTLRTGDRAEVIKNGSDVMFRLESSVRSPSECSLTWDPGLAVLEDGTVLS